MTSATLVNKLAELPKSAIFLCKTVVGENHVLQMHNSLLNEFDDFAMRILSKFYIENGANAKLQNKLHDFLSGVKLAVQTWEDKGELKRINFQNLIKSIWKS